jgi:hypothetical protein
MAATPARLVLSISLGTLGDEAKVCCLLKRDGGLLGDWRATAARFHLPETLNRREALYRGPQFEVPEEIATAMRSWMEPPAPLWLRLERPSGYLRLVPWEQLLQPRLGVPILRLPDFEMEQPRETPRSLDVVLCASAPEAKAPFDLAGNLLKIAGRLLNAVSRRTTLHVFTDRAAYPRLKQIWGNQEEPRQAPIRLYDPANAAPYSLLEPTSRIKDPTSRLESPWLLWIRDALGGRSIDVAHFLCHGYYWQDRGAIALAESPLQNGDPRTARFVGDVELSTFMTQIGAWSTILSSPDPNYSEMGLRLLADTVAQSRPGPVLHHEWRLDEDCEAFARACQFLYGRTGSPPPASPALLLYCQPSNLQPQVPAEVVFRSRSLGLEKAAPPELDDVYETAENVPSWVAAAERSIEQVNLRLQKMDAAGGKMREIELDPVQDTLRSIREIVARAAVKKREEL